MREIVEQVHVYKWSQRLFDVERLMASHRWLRKRKEGEERKDVEGRRNGAARARLSSPFVFWPSYSKHVVRISGIGLDERGGGEKAREYTERERER